MFSVLGALGWCSVAWGCLLSLCQRDSLDFVDGALCLFAVDSEHVRRWLKTCHNGQRASVCWERDGALLCPLFVPWLPSPPPSHLLPSFSLPTPYIPNDFQVWLLAPGSQDPILRRLGLCLHKHKTKDGGWEVEWGMQPKHNIRRWGERKLWSVVDKTSK